MNVHVRGLLFLFQFLWRSEGRVCNVLEYGAKADNRTNNAPSIAKAIAYCRKASGEGVHFTLLFPGLKFGNWFQNDGTSVNVYQTGSFNLTSHMTLRIDQGAALVASSKPEDYPLVDVLPSFGIGRDLAKNLNRQHAALIVGYNLTEVIIEGSGMAAGERNGVVDGNGWSWWAKYYNHSIEYTRPRLIEFMYSTDIVVRDLLIRDPAFWNTHFVYSNNILVENVNITAPLNAPNADGIDLDSVANATVRHCDISVGDDAIAIKSGLNMPGVKFGMPSQDIHIHDIYARSKCVSIGSEMSGGVHNVLIENVVFGDERPANGWHGMFMKTRSERGGTVSNVTWRNISTIANSSREVATPLITVDMIYGNGGEDTYKPSPVPPVFDNFTFEQIQVQNTNQVGIFRGLPNSPLGRMTIHNLTASNYNTGITCSYAPLVDTTFKDNNCTQEAAQVARDDFQMSFLLCAGLVSCCPFCLVLSCLVLKARMHANRLPNSLPLLRIGSHTAEGSIEN